jgi:hypothetical protein
MGWYEVVVLEIVFPFLFARILHKIGGQADTCGTRVLTSSELILGEMRNAVFLVREREGRRGTIFGVGTAELVQRTEGAVFRSRTFVLRFWIFGGKGIGKDKEGGGKAPRVWSAK